MLDRRVHGRKRLAGDGRVDFGYVPAVDAVYQTEVAAAQFDVGLTDQIERRTGVFQIHCQRVRNVVNLSHGADQQRCGNRDRAGFAVGFVAEFVVEGIFATDERRRQFDGQVLAGDRRTDQRSQRFGSIGVAPAKIVQDCDSGRVGTDRDGVADRFVDRRSGHVIRVQIAIAGIDAAGKNQAAAGVHFRANDGGVAGAALADAHDGFDHAAALDFVIVLPNDPVFAGDVG